MAGKVTTRKGGVNLTIYKCVYCNKSVTVNNAVKCSKCNSYYHSECSTIVNIKPDGSFAHCCNKRYSNINRNSQQFSSSSSGRPPVHRTSNISGTDSDNRIDNLDPSAKALWNLIDDRFKKQNIRLDDICDSIDNLSAAVTSINDRIDKLEDRVTALENNSDHMEHSVAMEIRDIIRREKNIIIYDFMDSADAHKTDLLNVQNIFNAAAEILPFDVNNIKTHRLGNKFSKKKSRPLKVVFESAEHTSWVFHNKKNIGDGKLNIKGDLTKNQQAYLKSLLVELNSRKENGEENLFLGYRDRVPYIGINNNNNNSVDNE